MTTATPVAVPATPPPPLASDLCWLMARTSHALMTEMTAALEQSGISPREHSVLVTAMTGSYTQTELARMVGLDKTTMVVTIDDLEAAGLAERRPSSTDRRARDRRDPGGQSQGPRRREGARPGPRGRPGRVARRRARRVPARAGTACVR